jgi:hypothetical protein
MNVELIYDRDCPNAETARTNLVRALAAANREAQWTEWDRSAPETPPHVKGYGSPTILVDGKDVAEEAAGRTGPSCRLYRNAANGFDRTPSLEQIAAALRVSDDAPANSTHRIGGAPMNERHDQVQKPRVYAAPIVSILSVIASVSCCLPLTFLAALGAAGASGVFAVLRPSLLVLSAAMLVIGFVQLYRQRKCSRRSVPAVALLWVAVAIFLAMLFFPQQVAGLLAGHLRL